MATCPGLDVSWQHQMGSPAMERRSFGVGQAACECRVQETSERPGTDRGGRVAQANLDLTPLSHTSPDPFVKGSTPVRDGSMAKEEA
jgi:hypothetical protein